MLEPSITEQQVCPRSVNTRHLFKKCCCSVLANISSNMCLLYFSNLRLPTRHFMKHFMSAFHSKKCTILLDCLAKWWRPMA